MDSRKSIQQSGLIYCPSIIDLGDTMSIDAYNESKALQAEFVEWISDYIDISGYPYMCVTAGITEAVNYCSINNEDGFQIIDNGEYRWISEFLNLDTVKVDIDSIKPNKDLYITNPQGGSGNYYSDTDWQNILDTPCNKILDLAYIMTTKKRKMVINDTISEIYFSMSKSFGVYGLRLGLSFHKEQPNGIWYLQRRGYFNHQTMRHIKHIINNYSPEHAYQTFKDQQESVCNELGLAKSDSVIMATGSITEGVEASDRICLSPAYK
jgi:hypothetical protein